MIAFLGSDGSGKSTCVDAIASWLSPVARVAREYHGSGDGPSSAFRLPLVLCRRLSGFNRHGRRTTGAALSQIPASRSRVRVALRALWAISLSLEKRAKIRRTWRLRERGQVVLCDRYPQMQIDGINDGPLLGHWATRGFPLGTLSRWERVPYEHATRRAPDLVLKLRVSPHTALERKPDMQLDEIRRRIRAVDALRFPSSKTEVIDADSPLESVLDQVKQKIREQFAAMSERSVVVEFLGVPGAGKSTLSIRLAERLRAAGLSVDERTYRIVHTRRFAARATSKLRRVVREALLHPVSTTRALRDVVATGQPTLSDLTTVGFNWVFLAGLCRETSDASVVIRDQGILQALWSIELFGDPARSESAFHHLVESAKIPNVVVVVEADQQSIVRRLKLRTKRWSRIETGPHPERLLERCVRLTDEIRRRLHAMKREFGFPEILVVRNDDDVDIEECAARLAGRLDPALGRVARFPEERRSAERPTGAANGRKPPKLA